LVLEAFYVLVIIIMEQSSLGIKKVIPYSWTVLQLAKYGDVPMKLMHQRSRHNFRH